MEIEDADVKIPSFPGVCTRHSDHHRDHACETMPVDRAAQVYDFARFLQAQPAGPSPIAGDPDAWLNDSEEQMQAEDAAWDAAYARYREKFAALREAARSEIEAGTTQPLFDEHEDVAQ